ncbi:MAG: monovalent cation/H(+) antiporter subunit G [Burkholderiaceae bacterium]|nr:monovalent cation/H(+) antiporter subunit G [Burkholderiaceae bacterium]
MTNLLACLFLLAGAAVSLLAAIGVLRLPDFFMRMHAATKAGVAGCGLVLIGVALADGSAATWAKVSVALVFLLLTTPVAGHLLGRAAYVSGAPFWHGTAEDALSGVLPRTDFESDEALDTQRGAQAGGIRSVVLALAKGPNLDAAIREALALARGHDAELCGMAIIDVPRLSNVGPGVAGAGWHAQAMRDRRIRLARIAAAEAIQRFEQHAAGSGLRWTVRLEEGRPAALLRSVAQPGCLLAVAPGAWFDQGVLEIKADPRRRLRWSGLRRDILLVGDPAGNVPDRETP